MADEWLRVEIANGLQGLVALSLDRQPAAEVLTLTADIWVRAFKPHALSEAIDAPRIRAAFDAIFGRVREWPAPKQVIDLMPDRPALPALPLPELSQDEWERGRLRFQEIIDGVAEKMNIRDMLKPGARNGQNGQNRR